MASLPSSSSSLLSLALLVLLPLLISSRAPYGTMCSFQYQQAFTSTLTETFNLSVQAVFQYTAAGPTPSSPLAQFLITSASGTDTESVMGTTYGTYRLSLLPVGSIRGNDNLLTPSAAAQLDANGFGFVVAVYGEQYQAYYASGRYQLYTSANPSLTWTVSNNAAPFTLLSCKTPSSTAVSSSVFSSSRASSSVSSSRHSSSAFSSSAPSSSVSSSAHSSSVFSSSAASSSVSSSPPSSSVYSSSAQSSSPQSSSVYSSSAASSSSSSPLTQPPSSTSSASAYSDPRFVGFWGQQWYVEGVVGGVYNLLSDAQVQVNARFVYRSNVTCPVTEDGSPVERCFSEAGTYFGQVAIRVHEGKWLRVVGGPVAEGFASVHMRDGTQVQVGQTHRVLSRGGGGERSVTSSGGTARIAEGSADSALPASPVFTPLAARQLRRAALHSRLRGGVGAVGVAVPGDDTSSALLRSPILSVHRPDTRRLTVLAGAYSFALTNMDGYVDVARLDTTCWQCVVDELRPDGLLGQTWNASAVIRGQSEAEVEAFREAQDDTLGCQHQHDRFCQRGTAKARADTNNARAQEW